MACEVVASTPELAKMPAGAVFSRALTPEQREAAWTVYRAAQQSVPRV